MQVATGSNSMTRLIGKIFLVFQLDNGREILVPHLQRGYAAIGALNHRGQTTAAKAMMRVLTEHTARMAETTSAMIEEFCAMELPDDFEPGDVSLTPVESEQHALVTLPGQDEPYTARSMKRLLLYLMTAAKDGRINPHQGVWLLQQANKILRPRDSGQDAETHAPTGQWSDGMIHETTLRFQDGTEQQVTTVGMGPIPVIDAVTGEPCDDVEVETTSRPLFESSE